MNEPRLPKPEIRGAGMVTYTCAACHMPIAEPWFSDGRWVADSILQLNPAVRAYHKEHLPNGR